MSLFKSLAFIELTLCHHLSGYHSLLLINAVTVLSCLLSVNFSCIQSLIYQKQQILDIGYWILVRAMRYRFNVLYVEISFKESLAIIY